MRDNTSNNHLKRNPTLEVLVKDLNMLHQGMNQFKEEMLTILNNEGDIFVNKTKIEKEHSIPRIFIFTYDKEGFEFSPLLKIMSNILSFLKVTGNTGIIKMKEVNLQEVASRLILDKLDDGILFCHWNITPFNFRDYHDVNTLVETLAVKNNNLVVVLALRHYCRDALGILYNKLEYAGVTYRHIRFPD